MKSTPETYLNRESCLIVLLFRLPIGLSVTIRVKGVSALLVLQSDPLGRFLVISEENLDPVSAVEITPYSKILIRTTNKFLSKYPGFSALSLIT